MKTLLFIILSLFQFQTDVITGKVIKVADGDTVTLLTDKKEQIKIRLDGIDCPERSQDFGTKAKDFTNSLCYGKRVKVEAKGIDKYGRTLGVIWVGSVNLNEELLHNGLAWHYIQYNHSQQYAELEKQAQQKKLNLWSIPNPIAPWDFRKAKKQKLLTNSPAIAAPQTQKR
jgi:endonuclease YncB( thermonuclease family)